jgi:alpha-1,6-mannosyltransferase
VNWTNLPTGFGEVTHLIVNWFGNVPEQPFVNLFRFFAIAGLVVIFVMQWWKARAGGPAAVRRAGITLLAVAILAPPTLPWYLTWGLAIFGATPWRRTWLAFSAGLAVLILLVYYPNGEGAMGDLPHMIWVILAAILAGVSMLKYDPLGLRRKPDDHGTLVGDVSPAAGEVIVDAEPATVEEPQPEPTADEPARSGPATVSSEG